MRTHLRRALPTAIIAAGLLIAGTGTAQAANDDDILDVNVGVDTSVGVDLGEISEKLPEVSLDTSLDLPEVDTEAAESAVDGVAGKDGVVDELVGLEEATGAAKGIVSGTAGQVVGGVAGSDLGKVTDRLPLRATISRALATDPGQTVGRILALGLPRAGELLGGGGVVDAVLRGGLPALTPAGLGNLTPIDDARITDADN